jgi:hypothetical protein
MTAREETTFGSAARLGRRKKALRFEDPVELARKALPVVE